MGEAVEKKKVEREAAERDGERRDEDPEEKTREDQEEIPEPDEQPAEEVPAAVALLGKLQDVVYFGIAVILLALGAAALVRTGTDLFSSHESFASRITEVVNGVLFVVIVLELLRTVLAHFQDSTFHLKPFLIIGIISVVRHILTVGAELSVKEEETGELFHRSDVELAVNALVVVALVVGLVLVRKTE